MTHVLVLGSGAIGRATRDALERRGCSVTLASRSGKAPLDASDAEALSAAAHGATAIVNAINPSRYTHWHIDWPPVASAILQAARRSGAGLVTVSNLYAYGRVDAPMTESTSIRPNGVKGRVRAAMWSEALAAHEAGEIRACEVRASDYFGPGVRRGVSVLHDFVLAPMLAGTRVLRPPFGSAHALHSFTYVDDIAELAATLATGDGWGRVWHVPTPPPRSMQQVAIDAASLLGMAPPTVRPIPKAALAPLSFVPIVRAIGETRHQFDQDFVLDSTFAERTFGLTPTPWQDALAATLRAMRA